MGKKYQRRNGETLADFNARCRASQPPLMTPKQLKRGGFTNGLWRLEERRRTAEARDVQRCAIRPTHALTFKCDRNETHEQ